MRNCSILSWIKYLDAMLSWPSVAFLLFSSTSTCFAQHHTQLHHTQALARPQAPLVPLSRRDDPPWWRLELCPSGYSSDGNWCYERNAQQWHTKCVRRFRDRRTDAVVREDLFWSPVQTCPEGTECRGMVFDNGGAEWRRITCLTPAQIANNVWPADRWRHDAARRQALPDRSWYVQHGRHPPKVLDMPPPVGECSTVQPSPARVTPPLATVTAAPATSPPAGPDSNSKRPVAEDEAAPIGCLLHVPLTLSLFPEAPGDTGAGTGPQRVHGEAEVPASVDWPRASIFGIVGTSGEADDAESSSGPSHSRGSRPKRRMRRFEAMQLAVKRKRDQEPLCQSADAEQLCEPVEVTPLVQSDVLQITLDLTLSLAETIAPMTLEMYLANIDAMSEYDKGSPSP